MPWTLQQWGRALKLIITISVLKNSTDHNYHHFSKTLCGDSVLWRRTPRCDDTLDGWVVGQVEEQAHVLHTSILLKILLEESAIIGEENEHKLSTPTLQSPCWHPWQQRQWRSCRCGRRGHFCLGAWPENLADRFEQQSHCEEARLPRKWGFSALERWSSSHRWQRCRSVPSPQGKSWGEKLNVRALEPDNTSFQGKVKSNGHVTFAHITPWVGVDGLALDIQVVLCHHCWAFINWLSRPIEHPGQKMFLIILFIVWNALYLPNMSSDTGVRRMSPVNSQVVLFASIPEVPSNTCVLNIYNQTHVF